MKSFKEFLVEAKELKVMETEDGKYFFEEDDYTSESYDDEEKAMEALKEYKKKKK